MNTFDLLGLRPELLQAVADLGYVAPTDIQAQAIPELLAGCDVLGQAQTGTGKTAAFTLPMLQHLDPDVEGVQALILTPTRELAIQVSQAVYNYGMPLDVRVLPIYGGQSYTRQMNRLKRSTQVVVGTPGRTLDLIGKGAMDLSDVRMVILDEADEMLKMGFIDDVSAILEATPKTRQTAMFSATMSERVMRLAARYMQNDPVEVSIKGDTLTVAATEQRYHLVEKEDRFAALTLVLEAETINSVLIFASTKIGAAELAEKLIARGYPAEALHGDLDQNVREMVLRRYRNGDIRILIGTDVMARGVDIPEVSHVINYNLPIRAEDYVHRIGRTGRAGRDGMAISLVTPRELHLVENIQDYTKEPIKRHPLPTPEAVMYQRDVRFLNELDGILQNNGLEDEQALIDDLLAEGYPAVGIAAAAIRMARAVEERRPIERVQDAQPNSRGSKRGSKRGKARTPFNKRKNDFSNKNMVKLRMAVGSTHGVHPGDVVGAVANESGISGRAIGMIDVKSHETYFDVEAELANKVLKKMQRTRLRGTAINISRVG